MEHEGIKDNTIKMYDNTIKEMEERGAPEDEISVVRAARKAAIESYEVEAGENEEVFKPKEGVDKKQVNTWEVRYNFERGVYNLKPIPKNMFLIHIGELPLYLFKTIWFNYEEKSLTICMYETTDFSAYDYFSKNKYVDELVLEFLDAKGGETVRKDRFKKLKVKKISTDSLSYSSNNEFLQTYITFKYKEYATATD